MAYELVRRGGYSGFGDATDDVLASLKDPAKAQEILTTAAAKGKALFSGDNLKQEAYRFAYAGARTLLEYANANPTVKRITSAADAAYGAGSQVLDYLNKIDSGEIKLDASGVADTIGMVQGFTKSIATFATAISGDAEVANEVMEWGGIVTGCAAGIAAGSSTVIGGVVAAIGCAMAFLVKILAVKGVRDDVAKETLRAVFVPNDLQQPFIQADATRLAVLLATRYGEPNIQRPLGRLNENATFSAAGGIFPAAPVDRSDTMPVPAVDAKFLLVMMDDPNKTPDQALDNVTFCLHALTGALPVAHSYAKGPIPIQVVKTEMPKKFDYSDLQLLRDSMVNRGDVNVTTIAFAAAVGRAQLARTGSTVYNIYGTPFEFDLLPFIRLDELLNFFVAVTLREHAAKQKPEDAILSGHLPVRTLGPAGAVKPWPYHPTCWTGQYPNNTPSMMECHSSDDFGPGLQDARRRVGRNEYPALKEFAMVRLQAAMTQLVLFYRWSPSGQKADLIADAASQQRKWYQLPIDPRQVVPTGSGWALNTADKIDERAVPTAAVLGIFRAESPDAWDTGWWKMPVVFDYPALGTMRYFDDDPTRPPLFDAVRNGERLASFVAANEAAIGGVIAKARQDALADANVKQLAAAGQLTVTNAVDKNVALASQVMTPTVAKTSLRAGTAQLTSNAVTSAVQRCLAAGATPTFAPDGSYGPTHPVLLRGYSVGQLRLYLAGTADEKTLAKWGLNRPDQTLVNLYCVKGGGVGTVIAVAGAALLIAKFMK